MIRPLLNSLISKFTATFALYATHNYCSETNEDCVVISLSSRHHGAKQSCNSDSFKSDCDRYPGVSLNDIIVDDAREHARSCSLLMTLNTVSWQWQLRWWRRRNVVAWDEAKIGDFSSLLFIRTSVSFILARQIRLD